MRPPRSQEATSTADTEKRTAFLSFECVAKIIKRGTKQLLKARRCNKRDHSLDKHILQEQTRAKEGVGQARNMGCRKGIRWNW